MQNLTLTTPILRLVVIRMLGFDTAYLHTKFYHSNVRCFRDMVGFMVPI